MNKKTMTLEQYNKKYRNRTQYLLKLKKSDADIYNKKFEHVVGNKYLFNGRKWQLIGDTYYQIPRPISFTWFRNLHAGVQVATCALLGVVVVGGAASPLIINYLLNGVVVDSNEVIFSYSKDEAGNINANIKTKDNTYEIKAIVVKTNDYEFVKDKDYTYDASTGDIKISADAIKEHKGRIHIVPTVTAVQLLEIDCERTLVIDFNKSKPASDLHIKYYPENAHNKQITSYKIIGDDAPFKLDNSSGKWVIMANGKSGTAELKLFAAEDNATIECDCFITVKDEEEPTTYDYLTFIDKGTESWVYLTPNKQSYPSHIVVPEKDPTTGNPVTSFLSNYSYSDPKVETITLPQTLLQITSSSFDGWESLKAVNFDGTSNLTTIGALAFNGCKSLEWFKIPNKVNLITMGAFNGCTSIRFVLEDGSDKFSLSNDRTMLFDKNKTLLYSMPHASGDVDISEYVSLKTLNDGVFYKNTNLTGITLPKTLTLINAHAFVGSSLVSATFLDTTHKWQIVDGRGSEPIIIRNEVSIDNPNENATNLKRDGEWASYYWIRKD